MGHGCEDLNMVGTGSSTSAQKAVLSYGSCTIANFGFASMAFDSFDVSGHKQARYITGCSRGKCTV